MRKLMMPCRGMRNAGLSLVELIISMAILAIVGTAVGGAMYVSSRSYTRGSAEVNVQEEAQTASNLICDWLVDATKVTPGAEEITLADDGSNSLVIEHPDGNGSVTISIFRLGNELKYSADKKSVANDGSISTETSSGVLCSNVYGAVFNSSFDSDRNVKFSLDFKINDRNYNAVTDSTSRNHSFVSTGGAAAANRPYILPDKVYTVGSDHYEVVLEPGQRNQGTYDSSYTFDFKVFGFDSSTVVLMNGISDSSQTQGGITLTYSQVSDTNVFNVKCESVDNASGMKQFTFTAYNPTDPSTLTHTIFVDVCIRRATKLDFIYNDVSSTFITSGSATEGKANSTYEATIDLGVEYGAQLNAFFDKNGGYKNPYKVEFLYAESADGSSFTPISNINSYIEIQSIDYGTSGNAFIKFKLKNDLTKDLYIVVVATHSGSMPNLGASNCKLVYSQPSTANRTGEVKGSSFTYASSTLGGTPDYAYYGVLKIEGSPEDEQIQMPHSSSIKRGTPSFEFGRLLDTGYNNFTNAVLTHCQAKYGNQNYSGKYKFCSVIYFGPEGSDESTWQPFVIYDTTQFSELQNHQMTQFVNANYSYIFEADKSYDYKIAYIAYNEDGSEVKRIESDSQTIPATLPYVYDTKDGSFKIGTYVDLDHARVFDRSEYPKINNNDQGKADYDFYVYFSNMNSANVNDTHVTWYVEKYKCIDAQNNTWGWVRETNLTLSWQEGFERSATNNSSYGIGSNATNYAADKYGTNSSNTISSIRLADGPNSGDTLHVGGYDQNRFPDNNMSYCSIRLKKEFISSAYDGTYRLVFGGDDSYREATGINYGSAGYNSSRGSVSGNNLCDCNLTGHSLNGDYGYIYFIIQP